MLASLSSVEHPQSWTGLPLPEGVVHLGHEKKESKRFVDKISSHALLRLFWQEIR